MRSFLGSSRCRWMLRSPQKLISFASWTLAAAPAPAPSTGPSPSPARVPAAASASSPSPASGGRGCCPAWIACLVQFAALPVTDRCTSCSWRIGLCLENASLIMVAFFPCIHGPHGVQHKTEAAMIPHQCRRYLTLRCGTKGPCLLDEALHKTALNLYGHPIS